MAPQADQMFMKEPQDYVRSLAATGSNVTVDRKIPIQRYFRSGSEMLRMAKMYLEEDQLENAFILYTKYTTLFIELLPKHPGYGSLSDEERLDTKKKLGSILTVAETVKAKLKIAYTKKYEIWKQEKEKQEAEERLRHLKLIEIEEKQKKEQQIREEFEKEKNWRLAQGREMLKSIESKSAENSNISFSLSMMDEVDRSNICDSRMSVISPTPSVYSIQSIESVENRALTTPTIDRSTKPRSILSPGPDSSYIHGLRLVIVPSRCIDDFLSLAKTNTDRNIETCGVLAGRVSHNQLMVTHLLIPKQTGTADSCTTDNEEDIFMYQDKFDLITLGWIHTHPSQTAFMSSVDLHTHCSYQLMMPEAIAIVCAPKYENTSIFSLTPDYGVDYISQCQQKGFHPHPNEPVIYEESIHVRLDNNESIAVIDLRK